MEIQAIFIYCLADSTLNALGIRDDPQCQMSNSEVMTFVLLSALFYQCNFKLTRLVIQHHRYFPKILSQSRLVRRIHRIPQEGWTILFAICRDFLCLKKSNDFIVDSFPVAACQNHKFFRCKLFKGKAYHGYTASKKSYFFGIKIHMIVNLEGIPIEFHFRSWFDKRC